MKKPFNRKTVSKRLEEMSAAELGALEKAVKRRQSPPVERFATAARESKTSRKHPSRKAYSPADLAALRPIKKEPPSEAFYEATKGLDCVSTKESLQLRKLAQRFIELAGELEEETALSEYEKTHFKGPHRGPREFAVYTLRRMSSVRAHLLRTAALAAGNPTEKPSIRSHVRACWRALAQAILVGEINLSEQELEQLPIGLCIHAARTGGEPYLAEVEAYLRKQRVELPKGWDDTVRDEVRKLLAKTIFSASKPR
jgi:hypothetical protein